MKHLIQYKKQILLLAFVLFALSILVDEWVKYNAQVGSVLKSISTKLTEQHDDFIELTEDTALIRNLIDKNYTEDELSYLGDKSYTVIVEKAKKVVFWSKFDVVPPQDVLAGYNDGRSLDRVANAYYQISKEQVESISETDSVGYFSDVVLYALQPIKYDYNWQNSYLQNKSSTFFNIPSIYKVVSTKDVDGRPITVEGSKSTIYLDQNEDEVVQPFSKLAILMQVLSIFLLLLLLYIVSVDIAQHRNGFFGILFLFITYLLLREMMFSLNIPVNLEQLDLFKAKTEIESYIPFASLGNMFISILMISAIFLFIYTHVDVSLPQSLLQKEDNKLVRIKRVGVFSGSMFALLFMGWMNYHLIRLLTLEFHISFHIRNVLIFDAFIGFLCLFLIIFCLFLFSLKLSRIIEQLDISLKDKLVYLAVMVVPVLIYIAIQQRPQQLVIVCWAFVFVVCSDKLMKQEKKGYSFRDLLIWGLVFCTFFSVVILSFERINERMNRAKFAEGLEVYKDIQAEHQLDAFHLEVKESKAIKKFMKMPYLGKQKLTKYIRRKLIDGKFSAYKVSIIIQGRDGYILYSDKEEKKKGTKKVVLDAQKEEKQNERRKTLITNKIINSSTVNEYTFQIPNNVTGNDDYISRVPIFSDEKGGSQIGFVTLELSPRFNGHIDNVYPELLIPGKFKSQGDYSFAIYNNGQLVSRKGMYNYKNKIESIFTELDNVDAVTGSRSDFIRYGGYSHFCLNPGKSKVIVVSYNRALFYQFLFLMAYLFGVTSIFVVLYLFISKFIANNKKDFSINKMLFNSLQNKINFFVLALTLGCFVMIGVATAYFFYYKTNRTNQDKLVQGSYEILSMINKEVNANIYLKDDSLQFEKVASKIEDIAENYSKTINLYDTLGYLKKSSMDAVFEKELVAAKMEPMAYYQMHINARSQFIQEEKVGELPYQAIYLPINDDNSKVMAYIGIPNFDQKEELRQEMSTFVVTLVNMYIVFFLISGALAIFIADNITRPLTLLKEKLQTIRLGQKNETVKPEMFAGSEEIVGLWREYNNTIVKLDESAANLRHSERESAWQDMARQVAHEINNPLTAMKLRLQHLQNAFNRNDERVKDIAMKTSETLIEQIDALSRIATDFSAIAKMTEPSPEIVDINNIISNVVDLNQGTENVKIFKYLPEEECMVFVDRSQILRVFNNLVKNAIQAIPDNREGIIIVSIKKKSTFIVIGVIDNGVGISHDKKEKVFVHNFTTKNSGMGIGLALSKRIIEGANGRIWFESTENKTTTFFVRLPLHIEGQPLIKEEDRVSFNGFTNGTLRVMDQENDLE